MSGGALLLESGFLESSNKGYFEKWSPVSSLSLSMENVGPAVILVGGSSGTLIDALTW